MNFDLKRPCKNCPFLADTTMVLQPGRMEGIVDNLKDDYNVFPCHKTTKHDENEDGESITVPHAKEQACAGALAYMWEHHGRIPVMARLAVRRRNLQITDLDAIEPLLAKPGEWKTE